MFSEGVFFVKGIMSKAECPCFMRLEIKLREDGRIILGKKSVNKCLIVCTNHKNCAIIKLC
jgi:hypothetical protein